MICPSSCSKCSRFLSCKTLDLKTTTWNQCPCWASRSYCHFHTSVLFIFTASPSQPKETVHICSACAKSFQSPPQYATIFVLASFPSHNPLRVSEQTDWYGDRLSFRGTNVSGLPGCSKGGEFNISSWSNVKIHTHSIYVIIRIIRMTFSHFLAMQLWVITKAVTAWCKSRLDETFAKLKGNAEVQGQLQRAIKNKVKSFFSH